jgi:hypothetical protein
MELSAVLARLDTEGYARLGRVLGDDGLPVQAGEVVVLHNQLWHRSGPSREGHRRRGFSVCYMSDAMRCLRKKRAPRQFLRVFEGRGVAFNQG